MRFHRSTKIGMVAAGMLALALLGPVFFAVLSLRSTPGSRGASAGAWIVMGILLVMVVAGAAAAGGALVAVARRVVRHLRRRAA